MKIADMTTPQLVELQKKWRRFQRKKAKATPSFSGEQLEEWKKEFYAKHKLET